MTQPPPPSRDQAVIAAYQAQTQQIRDWLTAYLTASWSALGYYGATEMAQFVKQVVPIVAAAQRQMSALTVGYFSAYRVAVLGRSIATRVDPGAVSGAAARSGVAPADVYARPFHTVWRQLDELPREPGSVEKAIESGLANAVSSAVTDVQLAKVQTSKLAAAADRQIVGYRRVLEGPHSCGLCVVASTRRYHKAELLPIHPACDCSVEPIFNGVNTSGAKDAATLSAVHEAIAERFGADSSAARTIPGQFIDGKPVAYSDVLIIHDHGELGPVLGVRGQHFENVKPATG